MTSFAATAQSYDQSGRLQAVAVAAPRPAGVVDGLRIETGADGLPRLFADDCSLGIFASAAGAERTRAFLAGRALS